MRYNSGQQLTFFVHWLKQTAEEATVTGTPTITIYHYESAAIQTDVNAQNMTNVAGTSIWYYPWTPTIEEMMNYFAVCSAVVSGLTVKTSEVFIIDNIYKVESGRWLISGTQMIFYDSDGITEMLKFNLKDSAGSPSATNVYERVPV